MKKGKKLLSIKSLRNKLDKEFNAYIRERDGKSILSGEKEGLVCSHYYGKRAVPYLRWDERNAHAMTKKEHWLHHHGREADYALWMFKHNAIKDMELLTKYSKKKIVYTREMLNNLIIKYTQKRKNI